MVERQSIAPLNDKVMSVFFLHTDGHDQNTFTQCRHLGVQHHDHRIEQHLEPETQTDFSSSFDLASASFLSPSAWPRKLDEDGRGETPDHGSSRRSITSDP
jgi:hypothetical protein